MALNGGDVTLLAVTFVVAQIALYTLKIYGGPKLERVINGKGSRAGPRYEFTPEAMEMLRSTRDHTRRLDTEVCGKGGCGETQGKLVLVLDGITDTLKDVAKTQQHTVELILINKPNKVRT